MSNLAVYDTVADVNTATVNDDILLLRGRNASEDGGGGWYVFSSASETEPDDGFDNIHDNGTGSQRRWFKKFKPYTRGNAINAAEYNFGVIGNTDAANAAALNEALRTGSDVELPCGTFGIDDTILLRTAGQSLFCPVRNGCRLMWKGGDAPVIAFENYNLISDDVDSPDTARSGKDDVSLINITISDMEMDFADKLWCNTREKHYAVELTNAANIFLINFKYNGGASYEETTFSDESGDPGLIGTAVDNERTRTATSAGQYRFHIGGVTSFVVPDPSALEVAVKESGGTDYTVIGIGATGHPYGWRYEFDFAAHQHSIVFIEKNAGSNPTTFSTYGLPNGASVRVRRKYLKSEPTSRHGVMVGRRILVKDTKYELQTNMATNTFVTDVASPLSMQTNSPTGGIGAASREIVATVNGEKWEYTVEDNGTHYQVVFNETVPKGAVVKTWREQLDRSNAGGEAWAHFFINPYIINGKVFINDGDCQIIGGYVYGNNEDYNVRVGHGGLKMTNVQFGAGRIAGVLLQETLGVPVRAIQLINCHHDGNRGFGKPGRAVTTFRDDDEVERVTLIANKFGPATKEGIRLANAKLCEIRDNTFWQCDSLDEGYPDIYVKGEGNIVGPNRHQREDHTYHGTGFWMEWPTPTTFGFTRTGEAVRTTLNVAPVEIVQDGSELNYYYPSPAVSEGASAWYGDPDLGSDVRTPVMMNGAYNARFNWWMAAEEKNVAHTGGAFYVGLGNGFLYVWTDNGAHRGIFYCIGNTVQTVHSTGITTDGSGTLLDVQCSGGIVTVTNNTAANRDVGYAVIRGPAA